jgi:hypothetical protein
MDEVHMGKWWAIPCAWLGVLGCAGPEPEFHRSSLIADEARAAEMETVDAVEIRALGLGATLSEGPPPPPFVADEEHYPPVVNVSTFDIALRSGTPRLVRPITVTTGGGDTTVTAIDSGELITVVVPHGAACAGVSAVLEGREYILIATPTADRRRHRLYTGVGAEYSVLPVDHLGVVATPEGPRSAAARECLSS